MIKPDPDSTSENGGVILAVRVIPRARKNELVGILDGGTLKIRLQAPPVEGKANQALRKFLAEILQIPAANIEIISGVNSRNKMVRIQGLGPLTAERRILDLVV